MYNVHPNLIDYIFLFCIQIAYILKYQFSLGLSFKCDNANLFLFYFILLMRDV